MNVWPFRSRRASRALVEELARRSEQLGKAAEQLTRAAGQPKPPEPYALIKLPIEGSAEITFVAAGDGELDRLFDWLDEGPYAAIADSIRGRRERG